MSFLRRLLSFLEPAPGCPPERAPFERHGDHGRDSLAAVNELSRLLAAKNGNDPLHGELDSDISLALGNLFRAQGDIDRAVSLREAVLADKSAGRDLRARTFFELARDYRKAGFLDRAQDAFKEARSGGFEQRSITLELARMFADSGDFAAAAAEYSRLDMPHAEAYCQVRLASELAGEGRDDAAKRHIRQALSIFPGSPEAHLALASMCLLAGDASKTVGHLRSGLEKANASGSLILLEGLYSFARGQAAPHLAGETLTQVASGLSAILNAAGPNAMLCYYAGLFLQLSGSWDEAEQWFSKALVIDPDFWAARLGMLSLISRREDLPPLLGQQVAFFTEQGVRSKRFLCNPCGLRRESVFSQCPRCLAWHSAAFRMRLT